MVKTRVPMHVDPTFEKKLKELQIKIMKKDGEKKSLREITKLIAKKPEFDLIENKVLGIDIPKDHPAIKFDKRILG